ncbi:hypothetical protein BMI90_17575 [Thioclava sp. L04-15]|uniref:exonuclease domain-containing protein n=1 Tax=Thioclava sp. L04-15 TaxID=1915318 RepID=UPI000997058F|nr:exonuclease domain-containing protein [Thioclava sp. L04-15]OOY26518.1 hypothetical protein BMI90_17575 [Thioclava sp. L04-15]TNE94761.1 MAG: hypothetical protein EP337_00150 [Paracoccaceae bacterium]
MEYTPEYLLAALMNAEPRPTSQAPSDARGLYGLVDHFGTLRYIGSTSSAAETLYKRIHQRHRTGSEDASHYFSRMYNTGRMWRDRKAPETADANLAKAVRNAFIADHCKAVWVTLPDSAPIAALEREVLEIAPKEAIAWNQRGMTTYEEPAALVDMTIRRLGLDARSCAALERQRELFEAGAKRPAAKTSRPQSRSVPKFPAGPFRFFALDVETANHDRASICQIGVACVRADDTIETWVTHVDPQTTTWRFTDLHGISARTVLGAPLFREILPILAEALAGATVYQHSGFDRSAVAAACSNACLELPNWHWRDSVQVARAAWPELRGNGGHGLGNLKQHLGLNFEHHDAGEDARAAAEVVLLAEGRQAKRSGSPAQIKSVQDFEDDFDLFEDSDDDTTAMVAPPQLHGSHDAIIAPDPSKTLVIGHSVLTQGNLTHNHIYLRSFFDAFPQDAIGGSSKALAAKREILVDWGSHAPISTDLDGQKKFFRARGWIREFFAKNDAKPGDVVLVEEVAPYRYRVSVRR